MRFLAVQYHKLSQERVRIENQLRSALELSFPELFPELNDIFPVIRSVVALQMIRKYTHPDYLAGLTVKGMTEQLYRIIGEHITKKLIASYCTKVWTAALNSYPAIAADSIEISIIGMLCDEIEGYNQRVALIKDQLIKKAASFPEFKLISSIPGARQLNTVLLMGFASQHLL
ncbi:IS110 family transposase [Lactobacillus laiwuensis]|uniref:IS110 family transposase n=1 Tax=Lactobacillus laiwuensis TaxID=2841034 RepID=UPI001CC7894C|nr:IS110 family transposase [Lactobacillus laiwuensis]